MSQTINIQENLEAIKLVEGDNFICDLPAIESEYSKLLANQSSVGIKIMSIVGGFISSLAFLGFLFISGIYESEMGLIICGTLLIAGSILLNIKYARLIIDTLSISAYVIGCCLLMFGLTEFDFDESIISLFLIILAISTLAITQTYMLSFIAVLMINGCFLFLIADNHLFNLIHLYNAVLMIGATLWFLNEARLIKTNAIISRLYFPVRIGLIISVICGLISVGKRDLFAIEYIWLSSVITIPLAIYIINKILNVMEVNDTNTKIKILVASLFILLPTSLSPAISGALIIILLSFLVNYKTSFAIGVIAFIYFISQYYYDLNFTLLTKSLILFFSGLVFLAFFLFTYKKFKSNE